MTIDAFNRILNQPNLDLDKVLHQDGGNGITLREPLNPPSAWTKFKAALSNVPLLGRLGALQQARQEVESYPVRLGQYQASNRQILAGFVADLRQTYGDHIADMAVRDLNLRDGAPLTARTVSQALQNVGRMQQQYRAMNNMDITRFLESPLAGGTRLPGETDMNGVFLDRGMALNGKSSWQDALGDGAARFITQYVMQCCSELPEHSQGRLDNARIAEFANKALDLYEELLAAPGMTPEKVSHHLNRVADANRGKAVEAKAYEARAREFVIVDRMEHWLDRSNPDSMLRSIAREVAGQMGVPEPPDGVLKSISRNMVEQLSYRTEAMPKEFGCSADASAIINALEPRLQQHVRAAVQEHLQAVQLIGQSTVLGQAGKDRLLQIASTRRIDTVQVREYERMTTSVEQAIRALAQGLPNRDYAPVLQALGGVLDASEHGLDAMKEHGESLWESNSLAGGEFSTQTMALVNELAVGTLSQDQARQLLDVLTGEQGRMLVQGMLHSSDLRMGGQFPMVYAMLTECVALRAGHAPSRALEIAQSVGNDAAPALYQLPPNLALPVLTSARDPDSSPVDGRGVVQGARNGKLVSKTFDPAQVLAQHRDDIIDYVSSRPAGSRPGISQMMEADTGRATFHVNGRRIGGTGIDRTQTLADFRNAFPPGPDGDAMALAVSRCMNQNGINLFFELANGQAFPGKFATFVNHQVVHEARQQPDGSWQIRSTLGCRPNAIGTGGVGEMQELDTDGVALYSLTYTVRPPAQPGGQPAIDVTGSQVVFNF